MPVFKDIKKAIKDMVVDATELEVNTFTGEVKSFLSTPAQGNKKVSLLDWSKIKTKIKTEANINLAASTQMKIDGDQNQFISNSITPSLMDSHRAAVEAGLQVRQGFVRLVKDIVTD